MIHLLVSLCFVRGICSDFVVIFVRFGFLCEAAGQAIVIKLLLALGGLLRLPQ